MYTWKAYALDLKKEHKDSLYSTLMSSEPILSSDLKITLNIKNSIEARELDQDKPNFLAYLRKNLKNYEINFDYKVAETTKVEFSDNKTKFAKLTKENQSLTKFKKLFNLDIEY